jgi:hypothetical protein
MNLQSLHPPFSHINSLLSVRTLFIAHPLIASKFRHVCCVSNSASIRVFRHHIPRRWWRRLSGTSERVSNYHYSDPSDWHHLKYNSRDLRLSEDHGMFHSSVKCTNSYEAYSSNVIDGRRQFPRHIVLVPRHGWPVRRFCWGGVRLPAVECEQLQLSIYL